MSSLFIKKPDFEKVAASRHFLGTDHTTWVKQIITHLLKQYPFLQNHYITVSWEKTDFNKGYAVGKISLGSGITIPVIVKEWVLYPLDVINKNGSFLPLNTWTAGEIFTSQVPFAPAKREVNPELTLFGDEELQFSPTGGTAPSNISEGVSKTRPAVKVASFIDRITNVNPKDVENILLKIKENNLEKQFVRNKTAEVLQKLSTIKLASIEDDVESIVRDLDLDISFVYEDEYGNKFLKQANSKVDYTWEVSVTDDEIETLRFKANPDGSGSFKFASYETQPVVISDPTIGDTGYFQLNNTTTPTLTIVNITKPKDSFQKFAVFSCDDRKLVIDENNNYYINDKLLVKTGGTFEVKGSIPQIGDYGTWVINNKAVEPFEVISIYKSATPGEYEIVGTTGIKKIAYYPIRVQGEDLITYDKTLNTDFAGGYYVPGNAKFIKLGKDLADDPNFAEKYLQEKIAEQDSEYGLLKIAGFNTSNGKIVVHIVDDKTQNAIIKKSEYEYDVPVQASFVMLQEVKVTNEGSIKKHACGRDSAGLYYFVGPEFNKYAESHPIRDLDRNSAIWTLLHCRGAEHDIRKLASLDVNQEFYITTKLEAPKPVKELAKELEKAAEAFDEFMPLKKVLVKHAAAMVDKSTVDAILSLGLINKKNLIEYVSMIPNYEIVLSQLAELLIMIRLGMSGISEYAVADSIEALSQVLLGLKEIESVIKV